MYYFMESPMQYLFQTVLKYNFIFSWGPAFIAAIQCGIANAQLRLHPVVLSRLWTLFIFRT